MSKKVKQVTHPVAKPKVVTKAKTIKVLVSENPKRGNSHNRFAFYKTGMTVGKYIERCEAVGLPATLAKADLRWDVNHMFIAIS
jgi:hypothetical protein